MLLIIFNLFSLYNISYDESIIIYKIIRDIYIFSSFFNPAKNNLIIILYALNSSNSTLSKLNQVLKQNMTFTSINYYHYKYSNNKCYINAILKFNKFINFKDSSLSKSVTYLDNYSSKKKYNSVLCITTFINYKRANQLKIFIQHYIKLGINLFVVYKTNCSEPVEKILKLYQRLGLLKIIYIDYQQSINKFKYGNYLHVWKHNDCFHRYKLYSSHILFFDQDELLKLPFINYRGYDIYFFYSLLNVSKDNKNKYSICPSVHWKYIIYNTKCVNYVDIHLINIKRKCKIKYIDYSNNYILHNRKEYPWYFNKCKYWYD